jgi:hypothetical protein
MNENMMTGSMPMDPRMAPPTGDVPMDPNMAPPMQGGRRQVLNKETILNIASKDSRLQQGIDEIEQQIANMPVSSGDVKEIIKMLEFVLNNPDKYEAVRAAAIKDGVVDEDQIPLQFDKVFIISLLVVLYGVEERLDRQGFARGGLAVARSLQAQGRGGDTMLAHINPREAEVLRRMGGSGTINPNTGLYEFKSFKKILGAALPIVLSIAIPGIGTAIGTALGAGTGIGASILGGAVLNAGSAALTGGNVGQAALMGGLGGGLGGVVGGVVAPGSNAAMQNIIGSGLVGGAYGAATGKGFLEGATSGAVGGYLGGKFGSGSNASINAGAKTFGNALTAGYDPKSAALSALAAGATNYASDAYRGTPDASQGLKMKPAEMTVDGLKGNPNNTLPDYKTSGLYADYTGRTLNNSQYPNLDGGSKFVDMPASLSESTGGLGKDFSLSTTPNAARSISSNFSTVPSDGSISNNLTVPAGYNNPIGSSIGTSQGSSGILGGDYGNLTTAGLLLAGSMSGAPPEAKEAVDAMSDDQKAYFNRPSVSWDWNRMMQDANRANLSLDDYMATNWNKVTSGVYNSSIKMANGGVLSMIGRFAEGAGSGRDDTIDAKLSDGEYVMDAETVALLGDGSNKEGALRLDAMRAKLRKHKGKEMSKGKFSANAKSPLQYFKGAM